jgi:hypothetical protein
MNEQVSPSEYLVISRGQWDKDLSRQEIQNAIDQFYVWLGRLVDEGKMKTGQRLREHGKNGFKKSGDGRPFWRSQGSHRRLLVHRGRQSRGSCDDCRGKSVSELRLVLRDPADRPGASHGLHGDDRDPKRTQKTTMTSRDIDGLAVWRGHDARTPSHLRTLQQDAAAGLTRSAHLHLRVYVLRHVR